MEEDRAEADIGQGIDAELLIREDAPRHPKKRFIGRRAATEKAKEQAVSQNTIEDSGAIQGHCRPPEGHIEEKLIYLCSGATSPDSSCPQSSSPRNP